MLRKVSPLSGAIAMYGHVEDFRGQRSVNTIRKGVICDSQPTAQGVDADTRFLMLLPHSILRLTFLYVNLGIGVRKAIEVLVDK